MQFSLFQREKVHRESISNPNFRTRFSFRGILQEHKEAGQRQRSWEDALDVGLLMLGACDTTVIGENMLPLQGQEEQTHPSSDSGQPTSAVVMTTGPSLTSHNPRVTWTPCKQTPGGFPPHTPCRSVHHSICSTFWGLNLKHPLSEIHPLRRPYGILFASVPSSTSLEKVPAGQDWKENIDKVSFLHRINSQEKKKIHLLQF